MKSPDSRTGSLQANPTVDQRNLRADKRISYRAGQNVIPHNFNIAAAVGMPAAHIRTGQVGGELRANQGVPDIPGRSRIGDDLSPYIEIALNELIEFVGRRGRSSSRHGSQFEQAMRRTGLNLEAGIRVSPEYFFRERIKVIGNGRRNLARMVQIEVIGPRLNLPDEENAARGQVRALFQNIADPHIVTALDGDRRRSGPLILRQRVEYLRPAAERAKHAQPGKRQRERGRAAQAVSSESGSDNAIRHGSLLGDFDNRKILSYIIIRGSCQGFACNLQSLRVGVQVAHGKQYVNRKISIGSAAGSEY